EGLLGGGGVIKKITFVTASAERAARARPRDRARAEADHSGRLRARGQGDASREEDQELPQGVGRALPGRSLIRSGAPERVAWRARAGCPGDQRAQDASGLGPLQHRQRAGSEGAASRRAQFEYSQRDSEMIVVLKHVEYRGRAVSSDGRAPDF